MRVVIDHVAGTRRGQRQELPATGRIRFGRHPDCEVAFDAHRDIDASSRHAELRPLETGWVLVDIGSSNGTYVDGRRVTETPVGPATATGVEFGMGGPRIRLFIGDDAAIEALAPAVIEVGRSAWLVPAIGIGVLVLLLVILAATC